MQERVGKRILSLAEKPYQGKPLHGKLKEFSLVVGDYRVVYEVRGNTVYLFAVGHRKKIYEKLEKF